MSTLIQVFARAPLAGQVKTRLMADVGPGRALEVYLQLLDFTLTQASASGFAVEVWMHGEGVQALNHAIAGHGPALPIYHQCGDDLGQRMHHALLSGHQRYDQVLLVGSDCIDLSPERLRRAQRLLEQGAELVLGPSADGGYYLVAPALPDMSLFAGVDWGSDRVWAQTLQRASRLGWQIQALELGHDLDVLEDLQRAIAFGVVK